MRKLLIFCCVLMYPFYCYPISFYENFESLKAKDGLNDNTIYDVYLGKKGFIWMATDKGISRYDGFRFCNYPLMSPAKDPSKQTPLAVKQINEGPNGLLILQLVHGGIACFQRFEEQYLPVCFDQPLEESSINAIVVEGTTLYLGTTHGLYTGKIAITGKGEGKQMVCTLNKSLLIKGNVSNLCSDKRGDVIACVDNTKIIYYHTRIQKAETIELGEEKETASLHMITLNVIGDYLFTCRARTNMVCYHLKQKKGRVLHHEVKDKGIALKATVVGDIEQIDPQTYYLSTWAGVYSLKFNSKELLAATYTIECVTEKEQSYKLRIENETTCLKWDDSQNILWIGTFGGGVLKIDANEGVYSRVNQQIEEEISGIEEDAQGRIWIATNRGGVWRSTQNVLSTTTTFTPWTKGIKADENYILYKDKTGDLWLGNDHASVIHIHPETEEVQQYQLKPKGNASFSATIKQFCLDSRGRLWIGTSKGLLLSDNANEQCHFVLSGKEQGLEVFAIAEDKEGIIWVGTDIGLKRIEMKEGKATLAGDYEQAAGLDVSRAYAVYVNNYNQLFASYGDRIIRIDGRAKKKVESVFTLMNGLNSGYVYCMSDDLNGNTWIGSSSGIMTLRYDRSSLYHYTSSGNCKKVCYLRDGRLLWANSWGLIFFDPLLVKNSPKRNTLTLSELWINGNPTIVSQKLNRTDQLDAPKVGNQTFIFNAADNELHFCFTDLQYSMMQRKIAYRLLPDEKEWTVGALDQGVVYKDLAAGKYTLQTKLIYSDATEGEILEIPLQVKSYWWNTIWAYLGYILLLTGVFQAVHHYYVRKWRIKEESRLGEKLLEEKMNETKVKQKRRQEIESIRNQLLTIFVQELRTPISLIITPLRELLKECTLPPEFAIKMQMAYRSSMGMLDSCNQLFSVYTQGYLSDKLKVTSYSAEKIVDEVLFSMSELMQVHGISFDYKKTVHSEQEIWIDKKKIEFVLHNIISNALNHVRFSDTISLRLEEIKKEEVRYCSISISYKRVSEVKIVQQMLNSSQESINLSEVELGYDTMENILQVHHGMIAMLNKEGETVLIIDLPLEKSVFDKDENILFVEPEEEKEVKLKEIQEETTVLAPMPTELTVEESTPPVKSKKTLLIVEDHKDIRLYLKVLFEKEYNILMANNGQEGIDMAIKELPDLILCDVMMPVKDGFECCKELKEGLDTCHIPFIMLTAKADDEDVIRGLELGANDYIFKPFTPNILKIKVRKQIEERLNLKQIYTRLLTPSATEAEKQVAKEEVEEVEDEFIKAVIKRIEENLCEPDFSVKKLATDMNMSQPTLYRKVKQSTDFSIVDLIRGVRMRKAAILLEKKQYSVQEVAEMIGYNTVPSFRKHFTEAFGTTPSTYAGIASEAEEKEENNPPEERRC